MNMKLNCIFRVALLGLAGAVVLPCALAQQNGQSGTGNNRANGNNNGNGQAINRGGWARTSGNSDSQSMSRRQNLLYISGAVVLDDGGAPPMGTMIERVCGSSVTKEAYVSPSGSFGFQVGAPSGVMADASDPEPQLGSDPYGYPFGASTSGSLAPGTRLNGCLLRASVGGYRSSEITLSVSQTSGSDDVGTIVIYPAVRVRGTTVSITSLQAPKSAKKALARAEKAFGRKDLKTAGAQLHAALNTYPSYAEAWYRLGQVYEESSRFDDAHSAFTSALKADADFVNPYVELARLAARAPDWQRAADLTEHALDLDPIDLPDGYLINSIANFNLNNTAAAERSARKLVQLDSAHRFPQVHLVLAGIFRRHNDRAGEAEQLRTYLKYAPRSADTSQVNTRLQELAGANPG